MSIDDKLHGIKPPDLDPDRWKKRLTWGFILLVAAVVAYILATRPAQAQTTTAKLPTWAGLRDFNTGAPFAFSTDQTPATAKDCAACMSYLDMVRTIDTIAQQDHALMLVWNRHWHPGAPEAGRNMTREELEQLSMRVAIDNTLRWHRLVQEWMAWTGIPEDNDSIPCAWDCTDWGPCNDGVERRTCVSNGHCHISTDPSPDRERPCDPEPPPGLPVKWATAFETTGACTLVATTGQPLSPKHGDGECAVITDGKYYGRTRGYNEGYPCQIAGVTEVHLIGYQDGQNTAWRSLLEGKLHASGKATRITRTAAGDWILQGAADRDISIRTEADRLVLELPEHVVATSLLGPNPWDWVLEGLELR